MLLKKKTLLLALAFLLFISQIALAQNYTQKTCVDNETLQVNTTMEMVINGENKSIQISENIYCQFGCDIDRCKPTIYVGTFSLTTELFVLLFAVFIIFVFVGWKFNAPIMSIFGSFFALIIGILMVTTGLTLGNVNYQDSYTLMIGLFHIGMFMYVLVSEAYG